MYPPGFDKKKRILNVLLSSSTKCSITRSPRMQCFIPLSQALHRPTWAELNKVLYAKDVSQELKTRGGA